MEPSHLLLVKTIENYIFDHFWWLNPHKTLVVDG